jgi:hypothetical protein
MIVENRETCGMRYLLAGGNITNGGSTVSIWPLTEDEYPDLYCLQIPQDISVTPSSATGLYCADDDQHLTYTIPTINFYSITCELLGTEINRQCRMPYSIREMANHWGPGEYEFSLGNASIPNNCNCNERTKSVTIVKLISETYAQTPNSRYRRILGIGEPVLVYTEPPTIVDWEIFGGGQISGYTGEGTVFTASRDPSTSTIEASFGNYSCNISFTVIAPTGWGTAVGGEPGCGISGPPNNTIGCGTIFDVTVLPTNVSFHWVEFRENIPGDVFTWPDNTPGSRSPGIGYFHVSEANGATDNVSQCGNPINRLDPPPPGGGYVNFQISVRVPIEYKNENNIWVSWLPGNTHVRDYRGSDAAGRAIYNATNTIYGSWQGPWR